MPACDCDCDCDCYVCVIAFRPFDLFDKVNSITLGCNKVLHLICPFLALEAHNANNTSIKMLSVCGNRGENERKQREEKQGNCHREWE